MFCTTNTTTNANEIKALTRVESEYFLVMTKTTSHNWQLSAGQEISPRRDLWTIHGAEESSGNNSSQAEAVEQVVGKT